MAENIVPMISVIVPVYNCRSYVAESINSILTQSFRDFELIIIDDVSTDGTYEFLQTLTDERIRLYRKEKNTGYTISLNMGLAMAKGKYIARMDGDDISLPQRFEKQVAFLEDHNEVILLGAAYQVIDSERRWIPAALVHEEIVAGMLEYSPFAHPSVMIRREPLRRNNISYNHEYEPAEDYKLWTELQEFGRVANLPDILLLYRQHASQTSVVRAERQRSITNRIRSELYTRLCRLADENFTEDRILHQVNNGADLERFFNNEALLKKGLETQNNFQDNHFYKARLNKILIESMYRQRKRLAYCLTLLPVLARFPKRVDFFFFLKLIAKSVLR